MSTNTPTPTLAEILTERGRYEAQIKQLERQLAEHAAPYNAAAQSVIAERGRQKSAEGWSEAHDDTHTFGELAQAAATYAHPNNSVCSFVSRWWPWHLAWWKPTPNERRRELVKAGALILAEIERLDRAAIVRPKQQEATP